MTVYAIKKTDLQGLEKLLLEASYSRERFIIQREDGSSIGIVPGEDMNTLEKMEDPAFSN